MRRRKGLRAIRQGQKLTQSQLARLTGITQTTISLLELQPDPNPTWHTVRRLAHALHVEPQQLFTWKDATTA